MAELAKSAYAQVLRRLLQTKPLSRITVVDLAKESGLARMTFYYHFHDIFDLVDWMVSRDISRILGANRTHDSWQEGFLALFKAARKEHVLVLNICNSMSRGQIERSLTPSVRALLRSVIEEDGAAAGIPHKDIDFIASYYTYAFIGVMLDWIDEGMRQASEEMVRRIDCVMGGSFTKAISAFQSYSDAQKPYTGPSV